MLIILTDINKIVEKLLEWPVKNTVLAEDATAVKVAEVSQGTKVFQDSGGFLAWTDGNQILLRCNKKYHEVFQGALRDLLPREFFEVSNLSFIEEVVREDNLLLSGPYLVFLSLPSNPVAENPCPDLEVEVLTSGIEKLYDYDGFSQALSYDDVEQATEEVVVMASQAGAVVGIASAIASHPDFRDIGVEVLIDAQQKGVGSCILQRLTTVIHEMDKVGTYIVSPINVSSIKLAIKAGYQLVGTVIYTI